MIKEAIEAFKNGEIVLIFDDDNRERETDMIMAAEFMTPQHMTTIRNDAGGLVCVPISADNAEKLGIPFMTDVMDAASEKYPVLGELTPNDIPYDEKSAFSITVNHRKTFTGITDNDRAYTIKELGLMCKNGNFQDFGKYFRAPGHVTLLRSTEGHVLKRKGHTEMSIALAEMAGTTQVAVCCEMMDDETGGSMNTDKVAEYAKKNDLVFLSGAELIEAYHEFKGI
ncbi:MAG: 3,4-dihydroxy 2-butanone 4-phosphate synthase [Methanobacterium sp.]|jgi:3,4-dihydroxy 2-butanone 4-phosphate synthase|uniref:3,4-dihydroxy-2-butanone-4-phosphate synthase n=1 Tax=Methanobacterium sp. TaxID=2164 RepID=UPI0003C99DA6|nr:3,4-dihydroxy-2-butanone-4-phosphate synthase [Methanobacterium sp.]MDI3548954.1 3,4-dihydroxy 2-butanone 4-phosphate synthase [Methanobacterium sp.]CDG64154.1 3,4-dihydroxy-2-butanone 4-phosphate synthase [Methanobacterium sp. MB1]